MTPRPDDIYLVIDEQDDDTLVVVATRWPELDALGRLRFPDRAPIAVSVREETLMSAIHPTRAKRASARPLRIGDVFSVRGLTAETGSRLAKTLDRIPAEWGRFIDVTGPARDAAKAALFAAAAPRVSAQHAQALGLMRKAPPDDPPTSGTTAGPVI